MWLSHKEALHTEPKSFLTQGFFREVTKRLICLMLAAGAVGSGVAAGSAAPLRELIPLPQQVEIKGAGFKPDAMTTIHATGDPADRFAANLLAEALRGTHGIDASINLESRAANLHSLRLSGIG